jgi:hypothetical protein
MCRNLTKRKNLDINVGSGHIIHVQVKDLDDIVDCSRRVDEKMN